jgi:hypothetical protein
MDIMGYVKKGFSFLTGPGNSFDAEKDTNLNEAFKYLLVLAVITAVLGAIVSAFWMTLAYIFIPPELMGFTSPPLIFVTILVMGYVGAVVASVIWGLWLHLWAYLMGARSGMAQTMKSVFYGGTPNYMLGWIPLINFMAAVWSFVLTGMGLMKFHGITGSKAALAIIIALVIPLVIGFAVLAAFLLPMLSALSAFQPGTIPGF